MDVLTQFGEWLDVMGLLAILAGFEVVVTLAMVIVLLKRKI